MKKLMFGFIVLSFISCKKDEANTNQPTIATPDLPQKITLTYSGASIPPNPAIVYAIKYDTANNKISVYEDDLATSNAYDKLHYEYRYNNGYLNSIKMLTYISGTVARETDYTITRDANNKIQLVSETFATGTGTVTYNWFYSNETTATGFIFKEEIQGSYFIYNYNSSNQLIQVTDSSTSGILTYRSNILYNACGTFNKSVSRYFTGRDIVEINSDFANGSASTPVTDKLCQKLLGKDYYLQPLLMRFYFIRDFIDYTQSKITYSLTDPNLFTELTQVSKSLTTGAQVFNQNISRSYQLDANSRLKKITDVLNGSSRNRTQTVEFTY